MPENVHPTQIILAIVGVRFIGNLIEDIVCQVAVCEVNYKQSVGGIGGLY